MAELGRGTGTLRQTARKAMLRTVAKETEMLLLTVIYGQEKTEVDAEIHGVQRGVPQRKI